MQGRQPPDQAAQSLALNAPRDGASTASSGNLRGSDQMPSRTSCFVFPLMLVCTVGEHNTIPPRAEEARQGVPGVSSAESMNCYTTVWSAPSLAPGTRGLAAPRNTDASLLSPPAHFPARTQLGSALDVVHTWILQLLSQNWSRQILSFPAHLPSGNTQVCTRRHSLAKLRSARPGIHPTCNRS